MLHEINPYGTHLVPLVVSLHYCRGPVIEMGCGSYSTPILHHLCRVQNRKLISFETNADWFRLFERYRKPHHELYLVANWDAVGLKDLQDGVVLVDHAPAERRKIDIARLAQP